MSRQPEVLSLREIAQLAWRMAQLMRPHRARLLRGVWLGVVAGSVSLAVPWVSKLLFDEALPAKDLSLATALLWGGAAISIASALMAAVRGLVTQIVGARLSAELNFFFARHLLQLPTTFFDSRRIGEITARSSDLQRSVGFVTGSLQTLVTNAVYFVIVPPVLLAIDWRLALLSLIGLPFTTGVSLAAGRLQRRFSRRLFDSSADAVGAFYDALGNIRAIKAATAEDAVLEDVRTRTVEMNLWTRRSTVLGVGVQFVNGTVRALAGAVYGLFGWKLLMSGEMSLGTFLAFSAYLGYLTGPVSQVASLFVTGQQAAVSLGRLFEYLDHPFEPVFASDVPLQRFAPREGSFAVEFRAVTFGYTADRPVLDRVSFAIHDPVTAIVGPSGAGKSSIVRLALRLYEPSTGQIALFGTPTTALPLRTVRQTVGAVFQEPGLLRGTVRDNLRIGNRHASESDIADVLETVQLTDHVASMPSGLDAVVAEGGISLSAGQRQRLSIARSLLRRPQILFLDEATSALDPATEREVLNRIVAQYRDLSIIVITHRLAVVRHVSSIYFASAGQVEGGGGHDALMASSSGYRALAEAGPPLALVVESPPSSLGVRGGGGG